MLPAAARGMDLDVVDELGDPHRLQWWDPIQGLWRDPEVDALMKHRAEVQAETERQLREIRAEAEHQLHEALLEERITGLHALLETRFSDLPNVRADIEANWRRAGQGRSTAEVAAVANGNAEWRSLLFLQESESA